MKGKWRMLLTALLAVVFVVTGARLVTDEIQRREARATYEEAARLAGLETPSETPQIQPDPTLPPTEPPTEAPSEPSTEPSTEPSARPLTKEEQLLVENIGTLQAVNSDVLGWISIPDTILSYPLLQGEDNDFYLYRTWKKEYSPWGSIYLDYHCDPTLEAWHTVIYGHRMRAEDMFGTLRYYKDAEYWAEHPLVYITTGEQVLCYEIFAAFQTNISTGHVYRLGMQGEQRQEYIDESLSQSVIDTGIQPSTDYPIITLSTCTAQGGDSPERWVVQAVLDPERSVQTAVSDVK